MGEREPATKREFAELLGVSTQTLLNYEKEPSLQQELARRARAEARIARLPDILGALYNIVMSPAYREAARVSAAKTLLDWMDKTEPIRTGETVDLSSLTEEELIMAAMEAAMAAHKERSE